MSDDLHVKIYCALCGNLLQYNILLKAYKNKQFIRLEIDPTTCGCMKEYKQQAIIKEA